MNGTRYERLRKGWALLVLGASLAGKVVWAGADNRHDGAYLHEVSTSVETPHTSWLKPCALGKPRILFLVRRPGNAGRMVVEAWQRMDMDFTAYTLAPDANERDYWESNIAGSRTAEKEAEAVQKLLQPYDAMVLIGFSPEWLPAEAKYWLLRQVKGGCGLVAVDCSLPFQITRDEAGDKAITTGIPFSTLPAYCSAQRLKGFGVASSKDVVPRVVQAGSFGRGRAVYVSLAGLGWEAEDETYADYHYALLIRALQWAIPSVTPSVRFAVLPEGAVIERSTLEKGEGTVEITLAATAPAKLTLKTALRSAILGHEAASEEQVDLKMGDNTVKVRLPALPAGAHFLDLWLCSDKGIVEFASLGLTVSSAERISELVLDSAFHGERDPEAGFTARFTEPLKADAALRLTTTDTYGRCVAELVQPLQAGVAEASGKIPLGLVVALANHVKAELRRGDRVLDARQTLLIVRRERPREFPSLLWGGCENGLDGLRQLRRQRETGFNISLTGASADGMTARFAALADMQLCIYATHVSGVTDGKEGKASNPDVMKKWAAQIVENCRQSAPYGVYIYSLGDECGSGGYDQKFAPSDVAAYREFLRTRYAGLNDLNKVWQTDFKSFDEIAPVDWQKSLGDPKLFPQLHERAAFVEHLYAKIMHDLRDALTAMDPAARVGAEGSEPGDLELTIQGLKMWGPYSDRRNDVLLASVAPREVVRGMWWGGYHSGFFDRSTTVANFWRQILEGVSNTNFFFDGHMGHHESNCASDMSWASYFEKMLPDLRKIYEVPGPLVSAASQLDFGVAIHWSQASEHASLFYAPLGTPKMEDEAVFSFFDRYAVNYRFVTSRMIEQDGLDPKRIKLFIVPMRSAVSSKEAAAMEAYVSRGGVLLATGSTGRMDGHCRLLEAGQLDKLLGIERTRPANPQPVNLDGKIQLLGTAADCPRVQLPVDTTVAPNGAQVGLAIRDVPILTVNTVGKGKAVFVNASLSTATSKGEQGRALLQVIMSALMKEARIEPLLEVEPTGAGRTYSFSLGRATIVSFLRDHAGPKELVIKLGRSAYVYDSLNGKALGKTAELRRTDKDGPFGLYCLLPEKAPEPWIKAKDVARRGELLAVRIGLSGGGGRLLRLDPYRPDGQWMQRLRKFAVLRGDDAELTIPLALNEREGAWVLKVTDVATGLNASVHVEVE